MEWGRNFKKLNSEEIKKILTLFLKIARCSSGS